ncbi:MAG: NAD(P)/FAD-dependent oxidoreductase [Bacteroidia bacterium]
MKKIIIIGGGASGFFAALRHKALFPENEVIILEKLGNVLAKVKISGGGRCNVTHACFEPKELVKFYPRGSKELLSPFSRFHAAHTVAWFEEREVALKVEEDGRMFPQSNESQTIIDALTGEAERLGVEVHLHTGVKNILQTADGFEITTNRKTYLAHSVMMATGSSPQMWELLEKLGHHIEKPVPSLFTFHIKDERLKELAGISVPQVEAKIVGEKITQTGALLITHWGLSGPAILRLSAWGARVLAEKSYQFRMQLNFVPQHSLETLTRYFLENKKQFAKKQVASNPFFELPLRLWRKLVAAAKLDDTLIWADISKIQLIALCEQLTQALFEVTGKSTFKEEFVTCGGVSRKEIQFKTMESKIVPQLFFGGEVIDIDAITGGFNFQAAWTTGWIAGENL